MNTIKPATPRNDVRGISQFGIGYGFITDATSDGKITINAKALAKIEPHGEDAIREMQRRANAYPGLVAALRLGRGAEDHLARQELLRDIGEA